MEHAADTWPEQLHDERRTARLLAALAVSVLCHASVLLLVRGWRLEADVAPPLVVTMVERGSGGPASDAASAPEPAAAAAAPVAVAAAPPTRPVAERVPRRPMAPTTRTAAPAVADAARVAARDESHAATTGGVDAGASGTGTVAASPGSGGPGHGGSGGGTGSGSDGLRALCARCPAPEYPGRARRQGWQGTVDVELAIARDGAVTEARIGRSSGYPALDEVALDVARQSRFTVPAEGDGLRGQLRYRFVLDEAAARR